MAQPRGTWLGSTSPWPTSAQASFATIPSQCQPNPHPITRCIGLLTGHPCTWQLGRSFRRSPRRQHIVLTYCSSKGAAAASSVPGTEGTPGKDPAHPRAFLSLEASHAGSPDLTTTDQLDSGTEQANEWHPRGVPGITSQLGAVWETMWGTSRLLALSACFVAASLALCSRLAAPFPSPPLICAAAHAAASDADTDPAKGSSAIGATSTSSSERPTRPRKQRGQQGTKTAASSKAARKEQRGKLLGRQASVFQAPKEPLFGDPTESSGTPMAHPLSAWWASGWPRPVEGRLGLKVSLPSPRSIPLQTWKPGRIQYAFDTLLERHPVVYVMLLLLLCSMLVVVGGFLFHTFRDPLLGRTVALEDAFWDAWGSVASSSSHLREITPEGRLIGFLLTLGGLFFYSLLTSTLTANFKMRMEWLREGAHSQVMEQNHIVVGGSNHHLPTLLRQLSKSHEYAVLDGKASSRKQTVLLLTEQSRRETEKALSSLIKECPHLKVLIRTGSLTSTASFKKVAADSARAVILLSTKDDYYEADADAVTSVMALMPLIKAKPTSVVVEVSKASTAQLLSSVSAARLSAVEDLSAKLFAQCCRQPGLADVYCILLDHNREVINLRNFPALAGIPFDNARRAFKDGVVCGIVRGGKVMFHPPLLEPLKEDDMIMIVAPKHTHREPPRKLLHEAVPRAPVYRKDPSSSSSDFPMLASTERREIALASSIHNTELSQRKYSSSSQKEEEGKKQYKTFDWTTAKAERILLLGWRLGVPDMIREFDDYVGPGSEVVILATESAAERERLLGRMITSPLRHLRVVHKEGSPMSRTDLRNAIFDKGSLFHKQASSANQELAFEDTPFSISVISESGWRSGDKARPDRQALFALLLADSVCRQERVKVQSLTGEFQDVKLAREVLSVYPSLTCIGTSDLMGLVTSQVAEHAELNAIWTELLNSWGDEIYVKDINLYKDDGDRPTFEELSERALAKNEVAIGIRQSGKVELNPCPKDVPLSFLPGDGLVLISEFE